MWCDIFLILYNVLLNFLLPSYKSVVTNACLWFVSYCGIDFTKCLLYLFMLPVALSETFDRNGSSEEDDVNNFIDPQAEDRELKTQLLRKYSGYLGSLKQEFMKKRKKGKLPKEARQQLLDWWSRHYKWPYPSVFICTLQLHHSS